MLWRYGGELRWMDSGGGPLLLVPGEHLPSWEGNDAPSHGRQIEAQFRWSGQDEPATNYDRACDVKEWLGLLDIGAGQGVVLGGEPLSTAWQASVPSPEREVEDNAGGILIRWVYANSEAEVIDALERVSEAAWRDDGMVLDVEWDQLYLLDAAYPGSQLADADYLAIHLPPGRYALATAEYEPNRRTSLLVHRLTRTGLGAQQTIEHVSQ